MTSRPTHQFINSFSNYVIVKNKNTFVNRQIELIFKYLIFSRKSLHQIYCNFFFNLCHNETKMVKQLLITWNCRHLVCLKSYILFIIISFLYFIYGSISTFDLSAENSFCYAKRSSIWQGCVCYWRHLTTWQMANFKIIKTFMEQSNNNLIFRTIIGQGL